jgi:hypothetical protein
MGVIFQALLKNYRSVYISLTVKIQQGSKCTYCVAYHNCGRVRFPLTVKNRDGPCKMSQNEKAILILGQTGRTGKVIANP